MECPNCGKVVPEEAQICPFCLFMIKDWQAGKPMMNDRGEILPKYEANEQAQTGTALKQPEVEIPSADQTANSFPRRGKQLQHPRQAVGHSSSPKAPISASEPLNQPVKSQINKAANQKTKSGAPKRPNFIHSDRADRIQEAAVLKKTQLRAAKPNLPQQPEVGAPLNQTLETAKNLTAEQKISSPQPAAANENGEDTAEKRDWQRLNANPVSQSANSNPMVTEASSSEALPKAEAEPSPSPHLERNSLATPEASDALRASKSAPLDYAKAQKKMRKLLRIWEAKIILLVNLNQPQN